MDLLGTYPQIYLEPAREFVWNLFRTYLWVYLESISKSVSKSVYNPCINLPVNLLGTLPINLFGIYL
jgi:hypothetical protein